MPLDDLYTGQGASAQAFGDRLESITPHDVNTLAAKYKYVLCGGTGGAVSCYDALGVHGLFYVEPGQVLPVRPTRILDNGYTQPSAITQGATGPTISVSGLADDAYDFAIEITTGGALGVGEYRWSLDGGSSWEESGLTLPGGFTKVLGTTGLTVTFTAGTYVLGETYTWTTPANKPATVATPLLGVF